MSVEEKVERWDEKREGERREEEGRRREGILRFTPSLS